MNAKRFLKRALLLGAAFISARGAGAEDKPGCKNPAWASKEMPGFEISSCVEKDWMSMDVALKDGVKTLQGSRGVVAYSLKWRAKRPAESDVRDFILQQAQDAGGLLATNPRGSSAMTLQNPAPAAEYWYLYRVFAADDQTVSSFTLTTVKIAPLKQEVKARAPLGAWDGPSSPCRNPPWLVRPFPGFKLEDCDGRDYDVLALELPGGTKTVAGHILDARYALAEGQKGPAALAVWKNYVDALHAIGASTASDPRTIESAVLTQKTPQGEFWYVYRKTGGDDEALSTYRLTSVQIGGPTPGSCKLEVYGIDFEPGSSTLRRDSLPVLTQLLAMLRNAPSFAAEIGGHTDDKGDPVANRRLSGERADAVRTWLTVNGIAGSRLTTVGYGDALPVAPNTSDENRARNRRFELKRIGCRP